MKPLHNHPIVKKAQELYEKHGYEPVSGCLNVPNKNHVCAECVCKKCKAFSFETEKCDCPQSTEKDKPCFECDRGTCGMHDLESLSPTESSWMEEEKEAFYKLCSDFTNDEYHNIAPYSMQKIADYWLSRIAETREAARIPLKL